ncbi:hypothetical protein ONZ51_g3483 [Trametes cubensis]|uniref:BAH domain-containing protein n=1 Tax=Trametes cubensis TaxID=1111947 RepID=A0AAD7U035_9APHY|nr:hypothetical protein ONZ51_g3483 [Trametes cubensis]
MTKKPAVKKWLQAATEEDIEFTHMIPAYGFIVDVLYINPFSHGGYTLKPVMFKKGNDVILNSPWDDTEDVWAGRISQIRTSPDQRKTLVKVHWYWSRNDISKQFKSFNSSQCAPFERILSDHYDYVEPYAFQGPRDLFMRTNLALANLPLSKRIPQFQPPLGHDTCLCASTYNPFPFCALPSLEALAASHEPMELQDLMHFCPSLKCRKWYHSSCLEVMQGNLDELPLETRNLRLLANNPDEEVLFVDFGYFYEKEAHEGMMLTDMVTLHDALRMLDRSPEIIAHLPASLLAIAQSPIIRCAGAPAGFAVGNVTDVVLARRLVYTAILNHGDPQASTKFAELLAREQMHESMPFWTGIEESSCDVVAHLRELTAGLEGFGTLASPYGKYWDRRMEEYKILADLFSGPALKCPQCQGAI